MSAQNNGGPAFPFGVKVIRRDGYGGGEQVIDDNEGGMTLRDYFAAKALQGMLANQHPYQANDEHMFARDAYVLADAMLKARAKGGAA